MKSYEALFNLSEFVQRPYAEQNLADNLLLCNAAHRRVAGIYRYATMISHNK